MVTDEQYRKLQDRVTELENKIASLSRQFSALLMRRDVPGDSSKPKEVTARKRDITKYRFEGEIFSKRNLVLQAVRKYVADNDITDPQKLKDAFPDYIQGPLGVVRNVTEAERYNGAQRRFFFADEYVIRFKEDTMVVCAQWDKNNINRFLHLMKDYGYLIESIERKY